MVDDKPHFLIIGAMKSGTTSLFRWLGHLSEIDLPQAKEMDFFSSEENWARGIDWYTSQFPQTGRLTGEASPSYTFPENAHKSAERIAATVPEARLIFLAREPLDRARSHYRHEVQKGRERRPLREALTLDSPYVSRSMYSAVLAPYREHFGAHRLLVTPFEELVNGSYDAWAMILEFLEVAPRPRPDPVHTSSFDKPQYSWLLRKLWESGALLQLRKLPAPLRRAGKRVLTSDTDRYRELLATSNDSVSNEVAIALERERDRFEALIGRRVWSGAYQ